MSLITAVHTIAHDRRLPYRVDRAVSRACRSLGLRERTITRAGLRFRVRRLTCDEDFVTNVVEQREYLQHGITIRPGDTVLDVGGNIGTFAVLAASLGARVIAVEPDPDNVRLLRRNVALNHADVTVVEAAAAGRAGLLTLLHASAGGGYHTTIAGHFARDFDTALTVPAVTLADLFARYSVDRCDLLKLDCEGAEYDIVDTVTPELAARIRQITMEYHTPPNGAGRVMRLLEHVQAHGFRVVHHEPFPVHAGGHLYFTRS